MDKQLRNALITTGFGVILFCALTNLPALCGAGLWALGTVQPLVIGGIIAFVLNVPMTKFSEAMLKNNGKRKRPLKESTAVSLSLLFTVLAVAAILVLVGALVVPQLITSVTSAVAVLTVKVPEWSAALEEYGIDADWLNSTFSFVKNIDFISALREGAAGVATNIISSISSTMGTVFNSAMAVVLALYLLLDKKKLARQCKKLMYAYLPKNAADGLCGTGALLRDTYSDFFTGQCLEAVILGMMMLAAFAVFRLPYAPLVAVLTAVCSFIPYIGSFLSCAVGAVLILLINPLKAVEAIVVYQVVQFCENQFVYPRVVGGAVGLPPLWTLLAVLVGGNLFGIVGMIFFIPLTAVVYTLIGRAAARRLAKKQLTVEDAQAEEEKQKNQNQK